MGNYSKDILSSSSSSPATGTGISADAWGRQKVVFDHSLLHGMFTYGVPNTMWKESLDGVEQTTITNAVSTNGKLELTSTTLNTKVKLDTYRNPRYEPNRGHLYSSSIFLPNKDNTGQRTFGFFTEESGVGFRLRDGVLYAFRRSTVDSVTTDYEQVINVPSSIDLEKGNIFDIQIQWRGVGSYKFYINNVLIYTWPLLGTLTELSIFNPAAPIAFECINQGQEVVINCGCVDVSSEGGTGGSKTYGSISLATDTGSVSINGLNIPILAVRNKETFNSLINTRDVQSLMVTGYADQRCVLRIWTTRDDTAITPDDQSWTDFGDGHLEYITYDVPNVSDPMDFDTTKADLVFSARVDQDTAYSTTALFDKIAEIYQTPGDIFVFTMHRETGGNTSVGVTYEFAEAI